MDEKNENATTLMSTADDDIVDDTETKQTLAPHQRQQKITEYFGTVLHILRLVPSF